MQDFGAKHKFFGGRNENATKTIYLLCGVLVDIMQFVVPTNIISFQILSVTENG